MLHKILFLIQILYISLGNLNHLIRTAHIRKASPINIASATTKQRRDSFLEVGFVVSAKSFYKTNASINKRTRNSRALGNRCALMARGGEPRVFMATTYIGTQVSVFTYGEWFLVLNFITFL